MSNTSVLVLGCGPAGLLAAHAAIELGADVEVASLKHESPIGGAQFLHKAVPGITALDPDTLVSYATIGTAEGYAKKVYGDTRAETSWRQFAGDQDAWSMQSAYQELRKRYWGMVQDMSIQPEMIEGFCKEFDIVLSTIPADKLCTEQKHERPLHDFYSQRIVLLPTGIITFPGEDIILYNGRERDKWYRTSRIFGHNWTEISLGGHEHPLWPGIEGQQPGIKPLHTDCDCHLLFGNFYRLGRFGRWQKKQLVHDAYEDAKAIVAAYKDGPPEGWDILGGKRMLESGDPRSYRGEL